MEISRRWFLRVTGLIFPFLTFKWRVAMAQLFFRPKRRIKPLRFDNPYKEGGGHWRLGLAWARKK